MGKICIITINYNNKTGLQKTFESIQNQTYRDFEYIVIDGGSTDGGLELNKKNNQISKWISEKDSGVYNAMNKGIKLCSSDYIIFMNSGDTFYTNDVLEKVVPLLNFENEIVYGNAYYYNDEGYKREEIPPSELTFWYLKVFGINHQSVFIKKKLFNDIQYYNEDFKICADWEFFMIAICLKNVKYKYIPLTICYYDFSGISAKKENIDLYLREKDLSLKKHFTIFYNDLIFLEISKTKRFKQFLHISQHKKISFRFLKWFMDIILLFTNKKRHIYNK
ncbi:MAG: glycosyltransferase [Flavobacterium sp.]|nr:glycosyltransferase [Flavobacterium sp.]